VGIACVSPEIWKCGGLPPRQPAPLVPISRPARRLDCPQGQQVAGRETRKAVTRGADRGGAVSFCVFCFRRKLGRALTSRGLPPVRGLDFPAASSRVYSQTWASHKASF
jgi:hypothetical protein